MWLGGYESRWFSEYCPDCGWERDCLDYRIMGFPVHTDNKDTSLTATLALRDLGLGCRHVKMEAATYERLWGGVLGPRSHICNLRLDNRYMYTQAVSRRVKQSGESDPGLAQKLKKRYLINGDADYFWENLLIDWVTLGAYDDGRATEARRWLTTPPTLYSEQILEEHPEITSEYVDSLYADDVKEVIVIWWPAEELRELLGDVVDSSLVVRLPSEMDHRRQVLHKINLKRRANGEQDLHDYGQQFAYAY